MLMVAATLAVALLRAVPLLAMVPSVPLTASIDDFSSDITSCDFFGHCWHATTLDDDRKGTHHCWRKTTVSTWQQSGLINRAYVRKPPGTYHQKHLGKT